MAGTRWVFALAATGIVCMLVACVGMQASEPFQVKLIALNDFHGNLESPGTFGADAAGPASRRPVVGGADWLAGHVAKLKAENPDNVVVAAGDLVGASPLVSSLFHDEPAVEVLNRMGLEFSAVGNHEFDQGAAELQRLQAGGCRIANGQPDPNSCKGAVVGTPVPFEGAHFKWLSANVVASSTGKPLLAAYGIKRFRGVPVAFIGMTLQATPTIVSPAGVAGLQFRDEADTVNALVPELRAQGVESIVVLVHQGGTQTGRLSDINGCDGQLAGSDIARIVARLDDAVDYVVSGHTHAAYNCRLPNKTGRLVPVTSASAYGRVVTDADLTIDPVTRQITQVAATNHLVSHDDASITPAPAIAAIVHAYANLVAPLSRKVVGSIARDLPAASIDGACNMPAGELVADAMLAATRAPERGGAQIALTNRGGVRNPGFVYASSQAGEGDGNVSYGEAFTVQPFGNSLVTMTLTAQGLKDVLEEQFAGCRGQSPTATRVMVASAGFHSTWDGAKACGARISDVTLRTAAGTETVVDATGHVVNPAKTYRVTVNSYMAAGGDGYATFLHGTQPTGGPQDIDALVAYLANFKAPAAPYAPGTAGADGGMRRIRRAGASAICPTGANANP